MPGCPGLHKDRDTEMDSRTKNPIYDSGKLKVEKSPLFTSLFPKKTSKEIGNGGA